jgi:hypothetical protein
MTYAFPAWELAADITSLKISAPAKQSPPHHWKFSEVNTGPRFAHGFQPYVCTCIPLYNKIVQQQAKVIQNENEHVHSIEQDEARHRKYKRLKLGGYQVLRLFK